ncbi:MAG: 2-dehydropantoate 2-reductase [Bacillota bacterium]|nr:2-dehydropantoate 2-reductase [Bacillota bacterium]MDW7684199.1 2-dehydropantoate 2-reductase [Bacillota bacterium]
MKIAVIGVGGVGGYFGGKLASHAEQYPSENTEVYFVARNEHLKAIKKNGLTVRTADEGEFVARPALATDCLAELPLLDVCLICVKGYDLPGVLHELKGRIQPDTKIIALLNGVDIYDRIRSVITDGITYPACVYIGTHLEKPGMIVQNGGSRTILLGEDTGHPGIFPRATLKLFAAAKISFSWCENPFTEIWTKYIFIAAFGMVTASENKTFGQILADRECSETVRAIMQEIVEIAKMKGIDLPAGIVADSMQKANNFPYETKTSFQRDFEQSGKPDERELFGDTIIRLGEAYRVATPTTQAVNEKLTRIK